MNFNRQDEIFCPPASTVNGGPAFSRHISRPGGGPNMDNPKDDVFSRPPVPGLNGLPRERKQRFSGGGSPSGLLRIKVEPQAFPMNGGTSPYSSQPLIPPNCIKSESGMAFKRYESYPPPPGSPLAMVSANSHSSLAVSDLIPPPPGGSTNSVQYHHNMRRYSLPEYKHQLHEPHPDILTPLNLTRRSSSSEITHAATSPPAGRPRYYSYHGTPAATMFQTTTASNMLLHPDVKRELPDGEFESDGLHNHFVFGGVGAPPGHDDHLLPHLQQRSRLSLSSKCRQNGGDDPSVEALYRDYGGRQDSDYDAVSPSRPVSSNGNGSNLEVYRGEFESSRMREAAIDGPTAVLPAKKEPDMDAKSSAGNGGNRGSGRTIIEFDGNDCVLCRVCGDKASGFHYGVHSCEGCKGFFRRSIQQKIQYRPCNKNQQCSILRINRNRCQYCRLKKCISAGMSRDAVRFGRVPKREKAKILAAMQSSKAKVLESRVLTEMADDRKIIDTIVRAHYDTCDYTVDKIKPFVERAHASPKLTQCTGQRCPLKGSPEMSFLDEFSDRFMDHVRQVCTFAKLIPGFKCLQHDDQVTLLKSCVFEVLTVRLSGLFDNQSLVCMNGDVIRRETISAMPAGNAKFLMDNVFELTQRINRFNLSDAEIGLFCAVVIISADRPGLRNAELVGRMQTKLKNILQSILVPQHPRHSAIFTELIAICQDLRTLNTLHTEKFLLQAKVMRDEVGGSLTPSSLASSSPLPPSSASVSVAAQHAILGQSYVDREWEENANCSTGSLDRDSTGSRSPQSSSDSPATSHSFSMEDLRRSPLGSVSSSESIANSETFSKLSVNDLKIHGSVLLNALTSPALSAQLAGAVSQSQSVTGGRHIGSASSHHNQHPSSRKRELSRSESGSSSTTCGRQTSPSSRGVEQDTSSSSNTSSGGHSSQESKCPYKARKLDSPSDSGIDSPKAQGSHSTNTSVCSSPRSSMEDGAMLPNAGDDNDGRPDLEEQHPLLKRALQQPPQPFNMGGGISNFQDEVYKPHKKFRHSDRKDGDEPTSTQDTGSSGSVSPGSTSSSSLVHSHSILASQLAAPPTYQRRSSPPPASASNSISALLAAAAANSSMVSSSQQMAGSSGITTLSRGAPPTHHQSLLATTLSRPVAVARAKRDEERSELLANLILDSGRYRPPTSHHVLQQHHNQKSQSLLMCAITTPSSPSASPLPAHTASELAARGCWSPAGAAAASVAASSSRHIPVPVAPSHSTTTSSPSLSGVSSGGSLNASSLPRGLAAAAVASAQKKSTATANTGFSCSESEDSMPLNLCVKSPASPSSVKSDQDASVMFGASAVKKEPLAAAAVSGAAVDSSE